MFGTAGSLAASGRRMRRWRDRWQAARDLLGGVLVLVVWLALWTSVWAAVAGPLSPVARERGAAAEVANAG